MTHAASSAAQDTQGSALLVSRKDHFLEAYDREHAITMRVLGAYPVDQLDLRPHAKCKSARELAWVFVLERGLGAMVFQDVFAAGGPAGDSPSAPESWEEILAAIEQGHRDFGALVRATSDEDLLGKVKFFVAPRTMGDVTRIDFAEFLLADEIHHRGQFTIYLRMSGARVPSVYGPSADEPWM